MWILPRSPFFPSAPEEEGSTSASGWRSDLLASSASLNGTHSPSASWSRRWKRAPWLQHLSGRISEPSMASRGVERWIASLRDTLANRSAKPEAVVARMMNDTCGPKFTEWCRRYVPPSSFWRTSQGMLDLGLEESSEISEQQATELRRLSSGLRMWAHRTNGRGYSSSPWKTPTGGTTLPGAAEVWATPTSHPRSHDPREVDHGVQLANQVDQWATPMDPSGGRTLPEDASPTGMMPDGTKRQVDLQHQARLWRTPDAPGEGGPRNQQQSVDNGHQVTIAEQAEHWPTPGVHNSPDASPNSQRECDLRETVKNWRTPTAECSEEPGERSTADPTVNSQARSFPQAPATSTPGEESSKRTRSFARLGHLTNSSDKRIAKLAQRALMRTKRSNAFTARRLNRHFVVWLMGWPLIGGNGSDSLEMESSLWRRRMRSHLLRLVSD